MGRGRDGDRGVKQAMRREIEAEERTIDDDDERRQSSECRSRAK